VTVVSGASIPASSDDIRHDLAGRVQAPADEDILSTLRYSHDVIDATLSAFPNAQDVWIRHSWKAPDWRKPLGGDALGGCSFYGVRSTKNASSKDGNISFILRIVPRLHAKSFKIGPCKAYMDPNGIRSNTDSLQIELRLQSKASSLFTLVGRSNNDPIQSLDGLARQLVNHLEKSLCDREFTSVVSWNEAAVIHLEESFRRSKLGHCLELESIKLVFEQLHKGAVCSTRLHEHSRSRSMGYNFPLSNILHGVLKHRHEISPTTSKNGKEMSSVCNITHPEASAANTDSAHANRDSRGSVQLQIHPHLVDVSVASHSNVASDIPTIARCFEEGRSRQSGTANDLPIMLDNFLGVLPNLPKDITDYVKVKISLDPKVVAATSANLVALPSYTLELKKGSSSESVSVIVTSDLQACFKLRFKDSRWRNRSIRVQRMVLQMSSMDAAAVNSLLTSPAKTQVSILAETSHLAASASATMKKVCEGVKFDDVAVVPGMLAEAVLRVVRPLTTGLKLEQVSLSVIIGDDPVTLTKTVSLTDLGARVPSAQRYVPLLDHVEFPSGYLPRTQRSTFFDQQ
jgi:hypothetical protein